MNLKVKFVSVLNAKNSTIFTIRKTIYAAPQWFLLQKIQLFYQNILSHVTFFQVFHITFTWYLD